MNNRIYKILENEINTYESTINHGVNTNGAIFGIFDNFFHEIDFDSSKGEVNGLKLVRVVKNNLPASGFDIGDDSFSEEGVGFYVIFDDVEYGVRFKSFRDGSDMVYKFNIRTTEQVKYKGEFLFKYLLYCALETSNLKGSYFTMPRDKFNWGIKTIENRTFDDIFLPNDITADLHLYVDIFKKSDKLLRYLKVGNLGVGKTESTIVIYNELNKLGVTIMKTPICDKLHQKMELANVLAPCLVIFDDIDLSLGSRNSGSYSRLLGDFLDILDGTDKLAANVGIIATTNATHLLDLAAQRPGRFDKTLLFDDINKDNIKNIILKSLKHNFDITEGKETDLFTHTHIVKKFYDSGVTGSHVYNSIKMLKLRYDTLGIEDITVPQILESISNELVVIEKVRKVSYLKEKYERGSGSIGFDRSEDKTSEPLEETSEPEEVIEADKSVDVDWGRRW